MSLSPRIVKWVCVRVSNAGSQVSMRLADSFVSRKTELPALVFHAEQRNVDNFPFRPENLICAENPWNSNNSSAFRNHGSYAILHYSQSFPRLSTGLSTAVENYVLSIWRRFTGRSPDIVDPSRIRPNGIPFTGFGSSERKACIGACQKRQHHGRSEDPSAQRQGTSPEQREPAGKKP